METEEEINAKILKITMVIQDNYPELLKYLGEMPITVPSVKNPKVNIEVLNNYYNSLLNIFRKYVSEHQLNYINQKSNLGHL